MRILAAFSTLALLAIVSFASAQGTLTPLETVHRAFAGRGSIESARLHVLEAMSGRSAAGAYGATRLEAGYGTAVDIGGGANLLLGQPVDLFGRFRAARRQGDAEVATARAALRQSALDVQQEALTAYAQLASAQRLLRSAGQQLDIAQALQTATRKRVEAQALPEIQNLRADLEVERVRQLVNDRTSAVEAARVRLAGALGTAPPDGEAADAIDADAVPAKDLQTTRPELQTLFASVAQADADLKVARQGLLPDFEIQAGKNTLNDFDNRDYGIRLQLNVPLWDHGATRERGRAASARKSSARLLLADRLQAATRDVEASRIDLEAAKRSVTGYRKLVDGAQTLLQKTQRGFELGANTLIDVLDSRTALSDAQELLIAAQLRRDLAAEALLRAQGLLLEEPK